MFTFHCMGSVCLCMYGLSSDLPVVHVEWQGKNLLLQLYDKCFCYKAFSFTPSKKRTLQHASSTSLHPQPHGFFLFHFMEAVFFAENLPFFLPPQSPKGGWTLWGQPYLQTMAAPLICTTDHVCWRATAECFWRKTDLTLTIIFW